MFKIKRITFFIFILCSLWLQCTWGEKSDSIFSPKVQIAFESFVQEHPSPVYYVLSESSDTSMTITLSTSSKYPSDFIDYYIIWGDTLVTYYAIDSIYDKSIINIDKMKRYKSQPIKGFHGDTILANCISHSAQYCISKNKIFQIPHHKHLLKFPQKVSNMDIFLVQDFNVKFNDFINHHDCPVTEIRFFQNKGDSYVAFYGNFYYDVTLIDGYFFRNKRFVALYGMEDIPMGFIKQTEVTQHKGSITGIRCGKRRIWSLPVPTVYKIKENKLEVIDQEKAFMLICGCF